MIAYKRLLTESAAAGCLVTSDAAAANDGPLQLDRRHSALDRAAVQTTDHR